MYVYRQSKDDASPSGYLFTVGFYDPDGNFHTDSDHSHPEEAARRVHFLNGGVGFFAPMLARMLEVIEGHAQESPRLFVPNGRA